MKNFVDNIISHKSNILDAMVMLNNNPMTRTLFVVDDNQRLLGTLTDGDIRRGFIRGLKLELLARDFMITEFKAVHNGFSVNEFKKAREIGIRVLPVIDSKGVITKVHDLRRRRSNLPLECVIMAGGRGERLKPLTDSVPKPMLMLGDKPILEHNIDRVISYGIEKIYITIRYLGQQIIDYFGDGSSKGVSIQYIWEDEPLGTAGALSMIKSIESEHFLLLNSDLFTDADFEDLFLNILKKQADLGIASVTHTVKIPYGIFEEENYIVKAIQEKPSYTKHANAGIYIIKTKMISYVPTGTYYDLTDLIEVLIEHDYTVIHNPIIGYWVDIGQHQDYINANQILKHQRHL